MRTPIRPKMLTYPALSRTIRLICRTGNPAVAPQLRTSEPIGERASSKHMEGVEGQPCSGKPSLRLVPQWVFSWLSRTRQGALANGADISRTQERQRCGTPNRSESALIERPAQAWLNVTHRSSHPEESIRQAHLVWEGQKNPPDGADRKSPVTRWRYA